MVETETYGPVKYRRENAVFVFSQCIFRDEIAIWADLSNKKPLLMILEDWEKHKNATDCYICNKSLIKDILLESIYVHDHDTGKYCGQNHKRCVITRPSEKYT